MTILNINSAPHAHDPSSVEKIMLQVSMALIPATLWGCYLFGWPAVFTWILGVVAALAAEALTLRWQGKSWYAVYDGSALLTGWLLALSLPPWSPWWLTVMGSFFAIMIGKHLYGGLGQNIFNPAMLARVALLVSFPVQMTSWPGMHPIGSSGSPGFLQSFSVLAGNTSGFDGLTGATPLGFIKTGLTQHHSVTELLAQGASWQELGTGFSQGSLGETSALFILIGGLALVAMRTITWMIPLAMLGTVAVLATIFSTVDPARYAPASFHLLSGALMLGAFFIATDPVTSPNSKKAQFWFGAGCGGLTYLIRSWGGYPEAVAFAVLMMNAISPLLNQYIRPRVYGRNRSGDPLKSRTRGGE